MNKKIKIGISSCPNDTFMFEAMLHKRVNTNNLEFELHIGDIEELNKMAINKELDITKLSYSAFTRVWDNYQLLNSGSALGKGNGPILISKRKIYPDEVNNISIAIPGENTTANMLLSIAYPQATNKTECLFSEIEEIVLSEETDAGLIIHENRFTYEKKGLFKIIDLGEFWENKTNLPIPLGGIAIRKDLKEELKTQIDKLLSESINFAFENSSTVLPFIKKYAQEMEEEVMFKHIGLYVNDYSKYIGKEGKKAVHTLFKEIGEINGKTPPPNIFVSESRLKDKRARAKE